MAKTTTHPWDITRYLESDEDIAAYLDAALEEDALNRIRHVIEAQGEIEGDLTSGEIRVRRPNLDPVSTAYEEEVIRFSELTGGVGGHSGGDERLMDDFIALLRGEAPSLGTTEIADSLTGHLIGFAADTAMQEHRVVEFEHEKVAREVVP